jgi:pantetheine-phosphate adenylyltransferase
MIRSALYAGSFDPVTNGHAGVVRAACRVCERLVIAVGVHHAKLPMLPAADRVKLLQDVCTPIAEAAGCALDVVTFTGLVTQAAIDNGTQVMVRGLRDSADFDYEMQMAGMNAMLAPDIQTVFLPAEPELRPISATLVRQIALMGGDVRPFVPPAVAAKLFSLVSHPDRGDLP